jgi:hypothetical protein
MPADALHEDPPGTLPLRLHADLPWVLWKALLDAPPPAESYTTAGVAMNQLLAQLREGHAAALASPANGG